MYRFNKYDKSKGESSIFSQFGIFIHESGENLFRFKTYEVKIGLCLKLLGVVSFTNI